MSLHVNRPWTEACKRGLCDPSAPRVMGYQGQWKWLSNYAPGTVTIPEWGLCFRNREAAYQAGKERSPEWRVTYTRLDPYSAKEMGRKADIWPNWETEHQEGSLRDRHMRRVLSCYFLENFPAENNDREKLILTWPMYLEETNGWGDMYWGVYHGQGQNKLGMFHMEIRKMLIEGAV